VWDFYFFTQKAKRLLFTFHSSLTEGFLVK
jgi:hypothetical protein